MELLHVRFIQSLAVLFLFTELVDAFSRIRFDISATFHPAADRRKPVQIVIPRLRGGVTVDVDMFKKSLQCGAVKLVYIYNRCTEAVVPLLELVKSAHIIIKGGLFDHIILQHLLQIGNISVDDGGKSGESLFTAIFDERVPALLKLDGNFIPETESSFVPFLLVLDVVEFLPDSFQTWLSVQYGVRIQDVEVYELLLSLARLDGRSEFFECDEI